MSKTCHEKSFMEREKEYRKNYDRLIQDTVDHVKKNDPERYKRAQNIGETLMSINVDDFGKEVYDTDKLLLKELLENIKDYQLTFNDLTTKDINLLKRVYPGQSGGKELWKVNIEYYIANL